MTSKCCLANSLLVLALIAVCLGGPRSLAAGQSVERKVYAHYMGCWPAACYALPWFYGQMLKETPAERFDRARWRKTYTASVGGGMVNFPLLPQGFQTNELWNAKMEIARAIRAGIDGFAFDAWAGGVGARKQLKVFLQAAEEMKVGFGITICFDPSCHPHGPKDGTMLEQFVKTAQYVLSFKDSPNLARFHGKPLFFGYHSNGIVSRVPGETAEDYRRRVAEGWAAWRKALPCEVYLHGSIDAQAAIKDPQPGEMATVGTWAAKTFDAVGGFLGVDHGWGLNKELADAVRANGAEWSQPLFYQYSNKLGGIITRAALDWLRLNWQKATENDSHLLQFVTWNDYGEETSLAPAYGSNYTVMRVNRHLADTWRTGQEPVVTKDSVHAVFRRSLDTYDSYPFASRRATRKTCLEVVTFLTASARVEVVGYGTFDAPAGQFFRQFPLQAGEIRIKVRRGGRSVIDWTSPECVAEKAWREDYELAAYGSDDEDEWRKDFPGFKPFFHTENADQDGDGLPNWWEMIYFGRFPDASTQTVADPKADPDGDGRDNLTEFRDRTDPLKADRADFEKGHIWRLTDCKNEPYAFNPIRDDRGHARWLIAYKFGEPRKIAHDGDYTAMDWAGGAGKHRSGGVYVKNPWGYGGSASVSTNGVVSLGGRPECLMALGWTSPVDGVVDLAATVEGGRGHGACYASFERGSEKFCETRLTSNKVSRLAMPAVPVKRGETIWLVDDHREAWGLGGLAIREWKVRLKDVSQP